MKLGWVKNTEGKPDAMLTFALVSFSVVTANVFLSTFGTIEIGGFSLTFTPMSGEIMAAYLGATFTAYVSRRFTDRMYAPSSSKTEVLDDDKTVPSA